VSDHRTIAESYSSATESSDLRMRTERRGDVDLMIAAGWIADGLGPMLYRLQVEFDSVRVMLRGQGHLSPIERFLVLDKLKTLRPAAEYLRGFAIGQAILTGAPVTSEVAKLVMGQVLDIFLDPTCHHCDGRGFNGGSHRGEPQTICRPCRGSGNRRENIGKNEQQRAFGAHLLAQMQLRLDEVDRQLRAFLKTYS